MPGPACYGRGGELPTVTDANMVLGRLNQKALLKGRMPVFPERGRKAIETHLCEALGMDLVRAASGIIEIVNVNMMGAVRVISVERGEDPRDFALMPFGGAGPLHAADIAMMMGMPRVFVPQRPGLLSAMGLLHADARGDFSITRLVLAEPGSVDTLNAGLKELERRSIAWLEREGAGAPSVFEWQAELRYFGQNFELPANLPAGSLDAETLASVVTRFHAAHEAAYGYSMPERPVEIVNLRLAVTVQRPVPPLNAQVPGGSLRDAVADERDVWFVGAGFVSTPVYDRDKLPAETRFQGPAIVEQMDTTTVVPPGATIDVDRAGNLMIEIPTAVEGKLQ